MRAKQEMLAVAGMKKANVMMEKIYILVFYYNLSCFVASEKYFAIM